MALPIVSPDDLSGIRPAFPEFTIGFYRGAWSSLKVAEHIGRARL